MKRTCMYSTGATAGRLDQSVGSFPSTYSPECTGQESRLLECPQMNQTPGACSGDRAILKVYVTCFVNDPVVGMSPCNIDELSSTAAPPATVSRLPTTTPVDLAPPYMDVDSASGADTTTDSLDFVTTCSVIGGPGPSEQSGVDIIIIIVASVMGTFVLIAAVILIVIIRLHGCKSHFKHSLGRVDETEPVDNKVSALYDDLIDVSTQQSQQEIPVYETIITTKSNSENTTSTNQAVKLTTNTMSCQVDLKENIAYETSSSITPQINEAYGVSACPVDLKENIAYELSSNITTQTNEALIWSQ